MKRVVADRYHRSVHGVNTKEYNAYKDMIRRCEDPTRKDFYLYGAIGRRVDPRWKGEGGWNNFMDHMGYAPHKGLSLERRDNTKDYTPENCCWATVEEQARNKSNTVQISYKGITLPLVTLSELVCLPYTRLYYQTQTRKIDIITAIKRIREQTRYEQEIIDFAAQY